MTAQPGRRSDNDVSAPLHATLFGSFKLTTEDGAELVISGKRARALLALLCIAPGEAWRILNSDFTFQGHTRAKLPFNDFGDGSFEVAGIVHWTHSPWPRNAFPGLELVAEFPFDRGNGPNRSDFAEVSIIPQVRFGLTKGGHVALNMGVQIPVNERDRFDYVAQMNLLWDFADGPFWKGW